MKKYVISLLVVLLALSLGGCGAKEKVEKKAGEILGEKILENVGFDAKIDGDKMVIKGQDGQEVTIGGADWPSSDLAKKIPEFKGGKLASLIESVDSVFIVIEDISDEDFTNYLEEVKKSFTNETYEINTDTGIIFSAANEENIVVMATYEKDEGCSISISRVEP